MGNGLFISLDTRDDRTRFKWVLSGDWIDGPKGKGKRKGQSTSEFYAKDLQNRNANKCTEEKQ